MATLSEKSKRDDQSYDHDHHHDYCSEGKAANVR